MDHAITLMKRKIFIMSEQVGSVTRKKYSDLHGKIRFQSTFTIRWELEDKNFLKIDIRAIYSRKNKTRLT